MRFVCLALLALATVGCEKDDSDDCSKIASSKITVASTVTSGESLNFSVSTEANAVSYYWTGPNGFTSIEKDIVIANALSSNAGSYQFQVTYANGCKKISNTDSIIVVQPATPCSPTNNTTSIAGATSMSFYRVTGAPSGGSYFITANSSNGDVEIEFSGTAKPVTGVYNIRALGSQWLRGDVRVRAVALSSNWPASSGKLYVTVTNNKVSAVFCNVPVSNQTFGFSSTASGKVSEN